ncbi:MAG: MFS transporter [Nitrospinales bacterium]
MQKPSYYRLLKNNRAFRNLWYGQVVSEFGSWLNSIAIYALILKLSGSGMSMAWAMMAKLLPVVVVSPWAGVLCDRISRKKVMIASDVLRFIVVLGLLLVDEKGDLWLLYTLVVLEVALSGFFEPARSAIIPTLSAKEDLVTANALSGSTWSVMLAFGAALGGVLVALVGIKVAFILDSLTFLLSAWFICNIPSSLEKLKPETPEGSRSGNFQDLRDAAKYFYAEPIILVLALLKSGLAIAGGILTVIPLFVHKILVGPSAISMGIGIMFSARGIAAAVGPILVTRIFGGSSPVLQRAIAAAFFLGALSYLLFSRSTTLLEASLSIAAATFFGSIVWVFSNALIHLQADKRFLGRVFSAEMAVMTLVMGLSNFGAGLAVDRLGLSPNEISFWMGIALIIPGVIWSGFLFFVRNRLKQGRSIGTVSPADPCGFMPSPPPLITRK